MIASVISRNKLLMFVLLSAILLFITACATLSIKDFGKFVPDNAVTAAFNKAEINPGFNYYITGSEAYPRSILGLNKGYTFDSDLWEQMEFKPKELKQLVAHMQRRAFDCCGNSLFGFAILDNKGRQIGIWYSIQVKSISVKVLDDRKVVIYPPDDKDYESYDEQGSNSSGFGK
ncbi:MAG: hypothetical protein AB2L12_02585 [Smithellaceae bacterium]